MWEKPYDKELMEEIDEIVRIDTNIVCPERDIMIECPHQAIKYKEYATSRDVDFNCGVATRYYDDGTKYVRAYALEPYGNGVAIFADKSSNRFTIFLLGEDDGSWFVSDTYGLYWISGKTSFISLVSEALSVFNANYKQPKKNK